MIFQSTLPVWGATTITLSYPARLPFQSTLPVWGATQGIAQLGLGDDISIHTPRVGSDGAAPVAVKSYGGFQSTLPVWGATGSG